MSDEVITIASCPFCGSKNVHEVASKFDGIEEWQVICLSCNASGPSSADIRITIARWNAIVQKGTSVK